jgi:hypothetical protein
MGSFNYSIPRSERPVSDILARIPRAFKDQAEKGFVVLGDIAKQHYAEVLQAVIATLESKKPPLDDLERSLKLSKADLSSLFAASMLTVPILGEGGNAEEFVSAAIKTGLMQENLVPKIQPFIDTIVSQRVAIGRAIRRASLPSQVFPSFSSIEVAVDLRMGFEQQKVVDAVAVAIVHIDTNTDGSEMWFQCSKHEMLQLKNEIEDAVKRIEAAESWGSREPKE